ncbi:MAG TPA: glycoside hydrolase family 172 protein, partial [Puia sp.]
VKGQGGMSNATAKGHAFESLKAGESKTLLNMQGAGRIQRIWCTISDRSPNMLRALRLQMYWDGANKPAVDVPLGDFFGAAFHPVAFQSALLSDPEGRSFNANIPMPFRTGAKVVLTNEGSQDLELLFFDIDYLTLPKLDAGDLYFHACWSRTRNAPIGQDAVLLPKVAGKGRLLGVSVGVNINPVYGGTWWGEGEVKAWLDRDAKYPTINGTGSEDYIGTGWGEGRFAHQYQGCLVADSPKNQYAFYRWHIPDAIYFDKDCQVSIQQIGGYSADSVKRMQARGVALKPVSLAGPKGFRGLFEPGQEGALDKSDTNDWLNFYRSDDYAATAYFYLDRPMSNLPALAPVTERYP